MFKVPVAAVQNSNRTLEQLCCSTEAEEEVAGPHSLALILVVEEVISVLCSVFLFSIG